jgi:hypothetical protein
MIGGRHPAAPESLPMTRIAFCLLALLAAGSGAARAQFNPVPSPPYFAVNPPSGGTPLQQQQIQNYRSQLLQTQRELRQRSPSGLTREQLEISRQLNAFDPGLDPVPPSALTAPPLAPAVPAPYP